MTVIDDGCIINEKEIVGLILIGTSINIVHKSNEVLPIRNVIDKNNITRFEKMIKMFSDDPALSRNIHKTESMDIKG